MNRKLEIHVQYFRPQIDCLRRRIESEGSGVLWKREGNPANIEKAFGEEEIFSNHWKISSRRRKQRSLTPPSFPLTVRSMWPHSSVTIWTQCVFDCNFERPSHTISTNNNTTQTKGQTMDNARQTIAIGFNTTGQIRYWILFVRIGFMLCLCFCVFLCVFSVQLFVVGFFGSDIGHILTCLDDWKS